MLERAFRSIRDGLLSLTYPSQCKICGEMVDSWEDGVVCHACWNDPSITKLLLDHLICNKCGIPVALPDISTSANTFCGGCNNLEYASARACGLYKGALESSILFLKTQPFICRRLDSIIIDTCSRHREALASDLVIPVPLHRKRRRERGFNQAEILAKRVSSAMGVALDVSSFVRVKHTERHRAGMDVIDRTRSVEKAFKITEPRLVTGAAILLVDDIYTTGSTVLAAAKALLEAGARKVNVLTIARVATVNSRIIRR